MNGANDGYANPNAVVDTAWVADHLDDPGVRLVEVSGDRRQYDAGHIPGALWMDWRTDLQCQSIRDFVTREAFETLLASRGIATEATVVLYGDHANRYAAAAFWFFKLYGHRDCRILDGGRDKWVAEDRPLSRELPRYSPATYRAQPVDLALRAFRDQVLAHVFAGLPLIDVRSRGEFDGGPAEGHAGEPAGAACRGAQRAGHIPNARNVPWSDATHPDGTFKRAGELRDLYLAAGIGPDEPVITYSHSGVRSGHTWFVLSQLLGYPDVRNYDGGWSEWGSLVRAPIEHPPGQALPGEK